jgi:hypothetical protein
MKGGLVIKQTWKHFAFTCAVLGKVMNASLSSAQDTGKLLGLKRDGRLAIVGVKSCAMLATLMLALSVVLIGAGKAPATEIAGQAQAKPDEEKAQIKPAMEQEKVIVTRRPTPVELESWRKTILKTPQPKKACFMATYPEKQWREVACKAPLTRLYPPRHGMRPETVGNGVDFSPVVTGHITTAEGMFDSVTGVTSECNVPCPGFVCPPTPSCSSPGAVANSYSLQLNTAPFTTSTCSGSPAPALCQGWEQFVYPSSGGGSIQYWLLDYGPAGTSCPAPTGAHCTPGYSYTDGWCPFSFSAGGDVYCVVNAAASTAAPGEPITSLGDIKLTGAAGHGAVDDSITVTVAGTVYSAPGGNYFPDLGTQWQEVEFNVVGDGNASQAAFNSGSEIHVRTGVISGTTSGPGCAAEGFTGETNNLTLGNVAPAAVTGTMPALLFWQSYPAPAGAVATCADATSVGDTHLTTFDGLYYDFQAYGDFVLAQDGPDFVVHARQASGAPMWPDASVNKAVATKMGKTRVAIYVEPTRLLIDGVANNLADGKTILMPTGVQVTRHGNLYLISSANGDRVRAMLNSSTTMSWIDVTVGLGRAPLSEARGLLGNPKGNAQVLETSHGVVLKEPVSFTDLYHTYADSWRVRPNESLFTEETTIKPGIPGKPFFASDLDPKVSARARAACKAAGIKVQELLEACTLDTTVLEGETPVKVFVHARAPIHVMRPILQIKPVKEVKK